jgi:hypothetical protein
MERTSARHMRRALGIEHEPSAMARISILCRRCRKLAAFNLARTERAATAGHYVAQASIKRRSTAWECLRIRAN